MPQHHTKQQSETKLNDARRLMEVDPARGFSEATHTIQIILNCCLMVTIFFT